MGERAFDPLKSEVGSKIKVAREAKGLSQDLLAALSNVGSESIRQWENGTVSPRTDNLIRIAAALGCMVEELMPDDYQERYSPQGVLVELGKLYGRPAVKDVVEPAGPERLLSGPVRAQSSSSPSRDLNSPARKASKKKAGEQQRRRPKSPGREGGITTTALRRAATARLVARSAHFRRAA